MQYQSIILQLIQDRPGLYKRLRQEHQLLQTVQLLAAELRQTHLDCQRQLRQDQPHLAEEQISSLAFEIALTEYLELLHHASSKAANQ
jgi:hypothetical protein